MDYVYSFSLDWFGPLDGLVGLSGALPELLSYLSGVNFFL